ncbi:competence protein ComFA [Paenibacillus algorifonticola]|uniref:Competence protein ComFA n=1 Tax=Paenibacillus algorifonticola TaxID=684063 RepID=A0A1I2I8W2_9BACL|nr:helicase-related protein [Paenibacillus algorifonticola]SFF38674.1 competence protein ComFA [Paenibacillus algorifonticola]
MRCIKAYIYIMLQSEYWTCKVTIKPEVDASFWENAEKLLLWKKSIPLGIAMEIADRFNANETNMWIDMGIVRSIGERTVNIFGKWLGRRGRRLWSRKRKGSGEGREEGRKREDDQLALGRLAEIISQARNELNWWTGQGMSTLDMREALAADRHERGGSARGVERAPVQALAAAAQLAAAALQGRALLRGEAHALLEGTAAAGAVPTLDKDAALQLASLLGLIQLRSAVSTARASREAGWPQRAQRGLRCLRCGSGEEQLHRTPCAACGREACAYCTACLTMGRSRECELLLLGAAGATSSSSSQSPPQKQRLAHWGLSPAQAAAAEAALHFIEQPSRPAPSHSTESSRVAPTRTLDANQTSFLLWAVTGAGKTEMTFPLVESILLRGGKALIATPRRDVVLELNPRIRKAFPEYSVVTLYGGSEQRWEPGDITLATTHQLLRFHHAFDLVILDELDAFPYHNNPQLHYAADKSCAPTGYRILLSATPPVELQQLARRGRLAHARVPVRFHRHSLPVPRLLSTPNVGQMLDKRQLPRRLRVAMLCSLERGAQLFVFVQRISQVERMAQLLQTTLNLLQVAGTSSQDPERVEKVQRFRAGAIRILVTTTILERGVTIPRSDVFILDADGQLFDEASLVQMAGRAGRSSDDPNGSVIFCAKERTRSQMMAVHHIKKMNRIARAKGYFRPI